MYEVSVNNLCMLTTTVNQFRSNLRRYIEEVIRDHQSLKVTRRNGDDFVVIGADDWEREQETLYILQNQSLMQQIAESLQTHQQQTGYTPTMEEVDEQVIYATSARPSPDAQLALIAVLFGYFASPF